VHPDDREAVGAVFAEVVATPGAVRTVEYRYLTKDGRWLWMEAVARNELHNPAVRGGVANSRDVSARKQAEEERRALEHQLLRAQKLESLGLLAGGMAHDFNNLLAIIVPELEALQPRTPEEQEAVEHIAQAARRGVELASQLLTFAGRREPVLEPVDLAALLDELAPLLRVMTRDGGRARATRLAVDVPAAVPPVLGDRGQPSQLILNLARDAVEAARADGTVTIRVLLRPVDAPAATIPTPAAERRPVELPAGPGVVLEVHDDGPGIPADVLPRIFEPFYSTKACSRGLGLAIVLGVVQRHGAGLRVVTSPEHGTIFAIHLKPTAPPDASLRSPPRGGFTGEALVIDDEPLVARATARLLQRLGFVVTVCTDGASAQALVTAAPEQFALAVCDVLMPGPSGPELVSALRAQYPTLPVLFVSGFAPVASDLRLDSRTTALVKPFDGATLAAALGALVGGAGSDTDPARGD
jgi:two-component system cell cycle sensor histidine kinase/response regulator CckA